MFYRTLYGLTMNDREIMGYPKQERIAHHCLHFEEPSNLFPRLEKLSVA